MEATAVPVTPVSNGNEPDLLPEDPALGPGAQKKKKKKKPKKSASAKAKDAAVAAENAKEKEDQAGRPPVLCISRNKHWRYISSYHGPWLQLPLELLESLLTLNLDPATLAAPELRSPLPAASTGSSAPNSKLIDNSYALPDLSPPNSPRPPSFTPTASLTFPATPSGPSGNVPPPFPVPESGKPTPPPIDPGVFRNVTSIRRLIDEAAELSVRASSGLSAAELNMMRSSSSPSINSSYGGYNSSWAGLTPGGGGGRNVAMSAMRIHRLRALAVQKLAAAYTADEIASSVMVMQGGSVFDDLAERVLKVDPTDADARYVHFFHEKIPSRQLAESTTTQVLDELIQNQPQKLEYYRTRGIVHCFRDEYSLATKDFTHALKEARAVRKAKVAHHHNYSPPSQNGKHGGGKGGKGRKAGGKQRKMSKDGDDEEGTEEQAGEEDAERDPDDAGFVPHPSVLPDAPTPLEPQLLFLRGAAYLQHAVYLIESTVLKLEGVHKYSDYFSDGYGGSFHNGELRLSYLEGSIYGGVEVGNPDGPLGRSTGKKAKAYREAFGVGDSGEGLPGSGEKLREQILGLVKKGMRDHERFLAHFDSLDAGPRFAPGGGDEAWNLPQKVEYAFLLSESIRPGSQSPPPPHPHTPARDGGPIGNYDIVARGSPTPQVPPPPPTSFTTYHPLLVEAHFSILLCQIMLGEFTNLLTTFIHTASVVDGLEGYPVFLPPRSMAQAEFIEVLERLAGGWKTGVGAYTIPGESGAGASARGKAKEKERLVNEDQLPETDAMDSGDLLSPRPSTYKAGQGSTISNAALGPRHNSFSSDSHLPESLLGGNSTSSSSSTSPSLTPRSMTPVVPSAPSPHAQALNSVRILLAPVLARQRAREIEKLALSRKNGKSGIKKSTSINIPLHGPRVDVILAWLGAVQIPALDAAP